MYMGVRFCHSDFVDGPATKGAVQEHAEAADPTTIRGKRANTPGDPADGGVKDAQRRAQSEKANADADA